MSTPDKDVPIHMLIAQSFDLLREVQKSKGSKEDFNSLRDKAKTLINHLDSDHLTSSLVQQALELTRSIAKGNVFQDELRKRADDIVSRQRDTSQLSTRRDSTLTTSSRPVDSWILDMFRSTESAIPRETLVEKFVERYRKERQINDNERYGGPWLFVFEAETEHGRQTGVRPIVGLGLHPQAFQDRCRQHLPKWAEDPFLKYVLKDGYDIDGWYALSFGGSPLFNALIDINRRLHNEPDYWLNAVYLPGDKRNSSRAVYILYRNAGGAYSPEPPPGQRQDMRLLTVLGLAWRQLEHQVKALARISESDRRDLINLIAPGLLHHEIGFTMRSAYAQAYEQFHLLKRIAVETGLEDVDLAARYAHGIAGLVHRLYRITDAFNNLDKRGKIEDSSLQQVFEELKILLHHRLGATHTDFSWDADIFRAQLLHTDIVLLAQSLINLLNNAINAFEDANTPPPRHIRAYVEIDEGTRLTLALVNNGPPILPDKMNEIFKRGYTTREQGHGQGLYLARLVAHYLGGDLQLMEAKSLPQDTNDQFTVGFRLTLRRHLSTEEGVARETD